MLSKGPIEENKVVCHTCDNRACVNPDHLFVGTVKDNIQDCIKKGRFRATGKPLEKHCRSGHDRSDSYVNGKGWTICRECVRIGGRRKWANKKAREALAEDEPEK